MGEEVVKIAAAAAVDVWLTTDDVRPGDENTNNLNEVNGYKFHRGCALKNCRSLLTPILDCGTRCRAESTSSASTMEPTEFIDSVELLPECLPVCWQLAAKNKGISFESCAVNLCQQTPPESETGGLQIMLETDDDYSDFQDSNDSSWIETLDDEKPSVLPTEQVKSVRWKKFGPRICAEALCQGHVGYKLVSCGRSFCHGE